MSAKDGFSDTEELRAEVKSRLHEEPIIRGLKEKLELTEEIAVAATTIFRLFVGLGKGLTSSQKRSFSAAAVWHAANLIEGKKISKEKLAEAADVSPRTLARRFSELEENEESELVLQYVKEKVRKWGKRREQRLQDLL